MLFLPLPPNTDHLFLNIIPNTHSKQTWISLTLFAATMRETPTARQNAPVRKKVESTDAVVSRGFHAGSFCCLNALLSGHLEGHASASCEAELFLFFISFLWEEETTYLCWTVFKLRYSLYCWETILLVQICIMTRNYLLTRSLSSSFSTFVYGLPRSACTNQMIVYSGQYVQIMLPGKAYIFIPAPQYNSIC